MSRCGPQIFLGPVSHLFAGGDMVLSLVLSCWWNEMRRPGIFKTQGLVISGCGLKCETPDHISRYNLSRPVTGAK